MQVRTQSAMSFEQPVHGQRRAAWAWLSAIVACSLLFIAQSAQASLILGTGDGALLDGDMTDPENNGAPEANVGYNAIFRASIEPGFGGGEFAFNVFDNLTGGGNNKWCCNQPTLWVEAEFATEKVLSHFTITSANDTPGRDPQNWRILASNDGTNYVEVFAHTGASVFTARDQTVLFDSGNFAGLGVSGDFAPLSFESGYKIYRFEVTQHFGDGAGFQLGELEFFGYDPFKLPEPSTFVILSLGTIAVTGAARRRRRRESIVGHNHQR